jgi:hypothetical protein
MNRKAMRPDVWFEVEVFVVRRAIFVVTSHRSEVQVLTIVCCLELRSFRYIKRSVRTRALNMRETYVLVLSLSLSLFLKLSQITKL